MQEFNNLSSGESIADFAAFRIIPLTHDSDGVVMESRPETCTIWGVYGWRDEWSPIHDSTSAADLVAALAPIAATGKPFSYYDIDRGGTVEGPFADLVDRLAETIHDEIPGYDDVADFCADNFDSHPLAELRESICEMVESV